jgi:hypothetical protein
MRIRKNEQKRQHRIVTEVVRFPDEFIDHQSIDGIAIKHGPARIIQRFLSEANSHLRNHGLDLTFSSFDTLVHVNEQNSQTWKPLLPTFLPQNGLVDSDRAFCLIGRNSEGLAVTTQAMCVFDWQNTNFAVEAEAMRLFYLHPKTMAPVQESCTVTAPLAHQISGQVCFGGAVWYHPTFRGRTLVPLLARISRAVAYARWQPDIVTAIFAQGLYSKGFPAMTGFTQFDLGIVLQNFALGPYLGVVGMITGQECLGDFESYLSSDTG